MPEAMPNFTFEPGALTVVRRTGPEAREQYDTDVVKLMFTEAGAKEWVRLREATGKWNQQKGAHVAMNGSRDKRTAARESSAVLGAPY